MTSMISSKGIARDMAWNSIGNFSYLVSQWLLTYFVTLLGGFSAAGVFAISMSIGSTLLSLSHFSMRNFQVSDVKPEFSNSCYLQSRHITCAASLLVCIAVIALGGYDIYESASILTYMVFRLTEAYADVYQGILQKNGHLDIVGVSFIVKAVVEPVAFIGALVVSKDLIVAIFALAIASGLVVFGFDRKKAFQYSDGWKYGYGLPVWRLLRKSAPYAVYGFLIAALGQYPRLVVDELLGSNALGSYASIAMPVAIIQSCANFIIVPIITPLALLFERGDTKQFSLLVMKVACAILALAVVAYPVAMWIGPFAMELMFGAEILPYVGLFPLLVVCGIVTAFVWFLAGVLTVLRQQGCLIVSVSFAMAAVVVSAAPLVSAIGMNGATVSLLCGLFCFTVISVVWLALLLRKL